MMGAVRGHGGEAHWWCALPDTGAAAPAAAALAQRGLVAARHPTGRPWLITASHAPIRVADGRPDLRAAAVGAILPSVERLIRCAETDSLAGLGAAQLVTIRRGRVRAFADAAGFRRVFTARTHGVVVASSHALVLRWLTDAALDRGWLAATLLSPDMPHALRQTRSPFAGITPVPAGYVAEIEGSGEVGHRQWWQPPEPELGLQDGATALRAALTGAVTEPTSTIGGPGRASVELSGGLDSAALASCLAVESRPLLATTAGSGPVSEDVTWARRVAERLPGAEHWIFDSDEMPLWFSHLDRVLEAPPTDEPPSFTPGAARLACLAEALSGQQVQLHLNGQGGDEVLLAPLAYLPGLVRRHPRGTWRHVRGQAALRRSSTVRLVRHGRRRPHSYARWLTGTARMLRTAEPRLAASLGWEPRPLLAPWATRRAHDLITEALAKAPATPVHEEPGVHATVHRIRCSAWRAGLYRDALAASGVPTTMPFFDHDVLEACLRVRPEARTDPWSPKPLLQTALGDRAGAVLTRRTKSGYNTDLYRGWAAHRDTVRDLLSHSRLAELDLVDQQIVDDELAQFGPGGRPPGPITDLLALETWLRSLTFGSW